VRDRGLLNAVGCPLGEPWDIQVQVRGRPILPMIRPDTFLVSRRLKYIFRVHPRPRLGGPEVLDFRGRDCGASLWGVGGFLHVHDQVVTLKAPLF